MKIPKNIGKIVIYFFIVFITLFLPIPIITVFFNILPANLITLNPDYYSNETNQFRPAGFEDNPSIQRVVYPKQFDEMQLVDRVSVVTENGQLIGLFSTTEYDNEEIVHNSVVQFKRDNNVETGKSYEAGNKMKTWFSDNTFCMTHKRGKFIFQIVAPDSTEKDNVKDKLISMGIASVRTDISPTTMGLKENAVWIVIGFILLYCIFWVVVVILKLGEWASAIKPMPGQKPIPKHELKQKILKLNELDTPFEIKEIAPDILTAQWNFSGKWKHLIGASSQDICIDLKMKLKGDSHTLSNMIQKKKIVKQKGLLRFQSKFVFFRGISLFDYTREYIYGLTYEDGQFKFTGKEFTFNLQEIKNPLIELTVSSGWKWAPRVFWL